METDANEFEKERADRIARNRLKLEQLGVTGIVEKIAEKAESKSKGGKKRKAAQVNANGNVRRSTRRGAENARKRLRELAKESDNEGNEDDDKIGSSDQEEPIGRKKKKNSSSGISENPESSRNSVNSENSESAESSENSSMDSESEDDEDDDVEGDSSEQVSDVSGTEELAGRPPKLNSLGTNPQKGRKTAKKRGSENVSNSPMTSTPPVRNQNRKSTLKSKTKGKNGGGRQKGTRKRYWPEGDSPQIFEGFRIFDESGVGLMGVQDLIRVAEKLEVFLDEGEMEQMMEYAHSVTGCKNSKLTFEEFQALVASLM